MHVGRAILTRFSGASVTAVSRNWKVFVNAARHTAVSRPEAEGRAWEVGELTVEADATLSQAFRRISDS